MIPPLSLHYLCAHYQLENSCVQIISAALELHALPLFSWSTGRKVLCTICGTTNGRVLLGSNCGQLCELFYGTCAGHFINASRYTLVSGLTNCKSYYYTVKFSCSYLQDMICLYLFSYSVVQCRMCLGGKFCLKFDI